MAKPIYLKLSIYRTLVCIYIYVHIGNKICLNQNLRDTSQIGSPTREHSVGAKMQVQRQSVWISIKGTQWILCHINHLNHSFYACWVCHQGLHYKQYVHQYILKAATIHLSKAKLWWKWKKGTQHISKCCVGYQKPI